MATLASEITAEESPAEEIIRIDQQVHDLLMRRAGLLRTVRKSETADAAEVSLRPGEDAATVRRLVERHRGDFPLRAMVRIWREILTASLTADVKYTVHVYAGENALAFWDLARTYFGATLPITGHASASAVVHACAENRLACGVVPLPESAENVSPWWSQLAAAGDGGTRIVAKLPLIVGDGGRFDYPPAYALGTIEQRPTGDDTSVLFLETEQALSRARLQSLLKKAGIDARIVAAGQEGAKTPTRELLLETRDFVGPTDPRLAKLAISAGDALLRINVVGGYANPVDYKA